MRPYLVGVPAYDPRSGGCKVIHRLAHELNARGQEAYVTHKKTNPKWNTPHYSVARNSDRLHDGLIGEFEPTYQEWRDTRDAISVYPEITFGNPMGTRTVARYLLNNAGKISGPRNYESSDLIFPFSRMFNDFNLPELRIMFLPVLNTNIFKDEHRERTHVSFYQGKTYQKSHYEETKNAIQIHRETSDNQYELSAILQTSTVLYCFDNITGMTEIARLCGCPVVIIPNGEYTKEQYDKHEMGWDGLGWGEIPPPFDSAKFMERYKELYQIFLQKLDNFIEITQNA